MEKIKRHFEKYKILENDLAFQILKTKKYKTEIERLCGPLIEFNIEKDENKIMFIIIYNDIVIAAFQGYIEDDKIVDTVTCAQQGNKLGEYLRYYALLKTNEANNSITKLTGAISGGIPALLERDTKEITIEKQERLKKYHEKRGAIIKEKTFTYSLNVINQKTF